MGGVGVAVAVRIDLVPRRCSRSIEARIVDRPADQCLFRRLEPDGVLTNPARHHARRFTTPLREPQRRGNHGDGEIAMPVADLVEGPAVGAATGNANFSQHLVLPPRRLVGAEEEVLRPDLAFAVHAVELQRGTHRDHHRRRLRRGIGVAEIAAEGAAIAHGVVRDRFIRFGQQRAALPDQWRVLHVVVSRQRADGDAVAVLIDVADIRNPVDVDQAGGFDQPEVHHGDQALTAGQDLGVGIVGERLERIVHARSAQVAEACGFHCVSAPRTARLAITPTRCAR